MASNFNISSIDADVLDQFRLKADPLADDVVAKIISSGFEKQIDQVFMTLVRNDSIKPETFSSLEPDLARIVHEYFEKTSQLPKWADPSLIMQGEKVFSAYGPEIFMLLNVSSLPLCYTCAKGAQVLYDTGRLLAHNNNVDPLARRLMETAQMVVNVLSTGGLAKEGKGLITIQKVRLIHASIRYFLKQGRYNNTPWNVKEFGEPINQEDLAGTLMSFAPVILSGLMRLDVQLSTKETNAYMHCWKVVGDLMGIQEPLLPDTYEEAFELATKILNHQAAPSEAGKALTSSCIQFVNSIVPGNVFDQVPAFFMEYFLEEFATSSQKDLSACIGVKTEEDVKDKLILSVTKFIIGEMSHLEKHQMIKKLVGVFSKHLLQGIIHHFNGAKNVHFLIPPSLQVDWKLTDEWTDHLTVVPNILGNRLEWQKKN